LKLSLRDFQGAQDTARVKEFLFGREQWPSPPDYWISGKSPVGTFHTIFDSPPSHNKFWYDEKGKFHAYVWLCPEPGETIEGELNSWRMVIHPEVKTTEFTKRVIASAEEQLHKLITGREPIETVVYGQDQWLASLLEESGYTKHDGLEVYMQRSLDEPIDKPSLASGYIIRPLDPEKDIYQRAGVQSDAFGGQSEPGQWAIENTKRFIRWYEGRRDLDLVAVSSKGEFASFAVFSIDPCTLVGELDPVGTRAVHQRKGLSKAVLLSGMQYMKSEGMKRAVVRTGVANTPAIHTYESVGFRVVDHLYRYTKAID
jgi:GNAT superfamily N-acetyltransferase